MRDLDHALRLIEATVGAVSVPVTLKMRLGWDERRCNAPELARRARRSRRQMITVHGRTRCQFYNGSADWPPSAPVDASVDIPVVVNGDIADLRGCAHARSTPPAPMRVMIGRGAQGRPWFPGQVAHYLATGEIGADAVARRSARPHCRRSTTTCSRITARASACAMRASISAGRSMPPRRLLACRQTLLKAARARCV